MGHLSEYFHKAGQLLLHQTTFLEFPFGYKGNQRGWNYLEHSVEFWLLSYREMGGDLWQGYVNLLRPVNSDFKIKKGRQQSAFILTNRNGVTGGHMLPVALAEGRPPVEARA